MRSEYSHRLQPHPVDCPRNGFWRKTLDRGKTMLLDFLWMVLSPLYPMPSLSAFPCCRFLENPFVATACSCYFLCQAWQTWCWLFGFCAACMLSYGCLPMECWAALTVVVIPSHPRRCKTSSVGQSAGLSVPRSPVRFWQKLRNIENSNLHFNV